MASPANDHAGFRLVGQHRLVPCQVGGEAEASRVERERSGALQASGKESPSLQCRDMAGNGDRSVNSLERGWQPIGNLADRAWRGSSATGPQPAVKQRQMKAAGSGRLPCWSQEKLTTSLPEDIRKTQSLALPSQLLIKNPRNNETSVGDRSEILEKRLPTPVLGAWRELHEQSRVQDDCG